MNGELLEKDIDFNIEPISDEYLIDVAFDATLSINDFVLNFSNANEIDSSDSSSKTLNENDSVTNKVNTNKGEDFVEIPESSHNQDDDFDFDLFTEMPTENIYHTANNDFEADDIDLDEDFSLFDSSTTSSGDIVMSHTDDDSIKNIPDLNSTTQDAFQKGKVLGVSETVIVTDNINEDVEKGEFKEEEFTKPLTAHFSAVPSDNTPTSDNESKSWFQRRKAKKAERLAKEQELDNQVIEYENQINDIKENLRIIDGKKPHSKVFNFFFGSVKRIATVAAVFTLIVSLSYISYSFYTENQRMVKGFENEGVIYWINNFVSHNYLECDSLIRKESDKIKTFERTQYFNDDIYYMYLIDSIGKNINGVDIISYYTENNITQYKIKVSYYKFKDITKLTASDSVLSSFKGIKSDYKDGKITLNEAQLKYESLHKQLFVENCLVPSTEISFVELTLYEIHDTDGSVYIEGTNELLNNIITDSNAKHNIGVYQQRIVPFTESLIK